MSRDGKKPTLFALAQTVLPSLIVLGAVFFFINSACSNGANDRYDDGPACKTTTDTPTGATLTIVEPAEASTFSGQDQEGLVDVKVELSATEIPIRSTADCEDGSGHFNLTVTRTDDTACPGGAPSQRYELYDGSSETTLRLAPGRYTVQADVFATYGTPFMPQITESVSIIVAGEASDAGTAPCP